MSDNCPLHVQEISSKIDKLQFKLEDHIADLRASIESLQRDLQKYSNDLTAVQVTRDQMQQRVDRLEETIYGNGRPGLKTQVAIIVSLGMAVMSALSVLSLFIRV